MTRAVETIVGAVVAVAFALWLILSLADIWRDRDRDR